MTLEFIYNQISFYVSLILVLFLPGYSLLLAIFGKNKLLSALERFIISFGLSIVSVDFLFFAYSKSDIPITRLSSLAGIGLFIAVCYLVYKTRRQNLQQAEAGESSQLFNFSKKQLILFLLLLFLTLFIKTAYLSGTVLPTATDMGHHMYWAKWMVENGKLPAYEGMPDFIIGEHVIFGIIGIIGNLSFFGAFPPLVLYLINLLGILTVLILVLRIFKSKNIAILTLLFLGVLYAVSSPQAKFVSGGVVGNIMGNFLMPLAFYFYYRSFTFFEEKESQDLRSAKTFLALAIFTTFGLFYTHHLTSFIFLFVIVLLAVIFILANIKGIKGILSAALKIIVSPQVLGILAVGLIFFFFVFTPTYVKTSAVETAVGAPSKATRAGLAISDVKMAVGEFRFALGFLGLLVLIFQYKKRNFGYAIVLAWTTMIFLMSTMPGFLFINLPSSRIGNYLAYPLAILSAYSLYAVFKNFSGNNLIKAGFAAILTFGFVGGLSDSALAFKTTNGATGMSQTFHSSKYLAERVENNDAILKDHNYLSSDSWIKLFFMRGYKYPQSRGYFKRYEDPTKPREMCTLVMISNPASPEAKKCFSETGTNFLMVNPKYDSAQFKKLKEFNQIYSNPSVTIYYKRK